MTVLKIDDNKARELYPSANSELKAILEASYPEGFFNQSIIDRTPTVEAALAIAGKTIAGLTRKDDAPYETAGRIIENVIAVLNEGEAVDHSNDDQTKWEPRFIHKSGLGLRYHYYVCWYANSYVGPRLCYLSYDKMIHGVKILESYYNIYLNSK